MMEFDNLLFNIEKILKESLYCEDNNLRIKNKLKYDIFNLINEIDRKFIVDVCKELEYEEGNNE